jgi:hypothetical protein
MITSYHPQIDRKTKVVNKCLEGYLRNFVNDHQSQWHSWIHILLEWWYNTTYHTSTKMTPFEALYGYPPSSIKEYVVSNFKALAKKNYLATSNEILSYPKKSSRAI